MPRNAPTKRVLVTGAAGKTGLAVLTALKRLDSDTTPRPWLRALGRNIRQKRVLDQAGANEVIYADLMDESSLEPALDGVDAVYHICPNVHPEEVAIGDRMIRLALRTGVHRFVFHSVLDPRIREMPHHWAKARVEELLAQSKLDVTILQPAPYMQNILAQRSSILETGRYRVPYALTTRVPMVDLDDLAEVAAKALTTEAVGGTYELCAPGCLDQSEIAGELERAAGRTVRAEAMSRASWADSARSSGLSDQQIETLLAMFRYYELRGMSGSHTELETLLGRSPTTFGQFVDRAFGDRDVPSRVC